MHSTDARIIIIIIDRIVFNLIADAQQRWTKLLLFLVCQPSPLAAWHFFPCLLHRAKTLRVGITYSNDRMCVCVVVLYYGANAKLSQVYYLNYIRLGYIRLDITFGPVPNLRNSSFKAQSTLACSIYIWPRLASARRGGGGIFHFRLPFSYAENAQVLGTPETEWNGSISMHLGEPKTFLIIGMHKWRGKFFFHSKLTRTNT